MGPDLPSADSMSLVPDRSGQQTLEHRPTSSTPLPVQTVTTVAEGASAVASAENPSSFGRYTLLSEPLRVGMGVVYKAWDPQLRRNVALKMMRSGLVAGDEEVKRFLQEARAAARLNHPHIVPILNVGQLAGRHYFTMAWADGGSLLGHIKRQRQDPRSAAKLVAKIARAVHYAHTKGVLHRDLKPGNVLLDERGKPQVSDFGLAKLLDAGEEITIDGQVLGTPAYMSPEQAAGKTTYLVTGRPGWIFSLNERHFVSAPCQGR